MLQPRIFIFSILALIIFPAAALAHETSQENFQSFISSYNSIYEKYPGAFKTLIGTETIKVSYKVLDGDEITFGVKTVDGKITEANATAYTDSTLAVSVSEETLNRIVNSKDPLTEFKNAWGGEIKVEGISIMAKIKVFFIGLIESILKLFSR